MITRHYLFVNIWKVTNYWTSIGKK